ncbi:MAG: regulator [Oscillibacter sp.]|nr:regulator [Oscillibacter sp.]
MLKTVNTDKIPSIPNAPFSQGVIAGEMLFLSGQVGTDPASGKLVDGGVQAQAEQAIRNIGVILESCGVSYESVVKATCFLSDIGDFGPFNDVYSRYFTGKPARSCFAVKDLPMGALVEVEVIVSLGK